MHIQAFSIVFISCLIAFSISNLIGKFYGFPEDTNRIATIDGLRGYLALFVFIHLSAHWYNYIHDGKWISDPYLFAHLGQSSVALFFMITGYLFYSKLVQSKFKSINWKSFFVARFMRLAPLYYSMVACVFLIVIFETAGSSRANFNQLLTQLTSWLLFTIPGQPNINGHIGTWRITSGVTWSLVYEWLFYFSLPLVALLSKLQPPKKYLALSLVTIAAIILINHTIKYHYLLMFVYGMLAYYLSNSMVLRQFSLSTTASAIASVLIVFLVTHFQDLTGNKALFILGIVFILIASGTDLFGALSNKVSRHLGDLAYSIYLLHGITLYVLFNYLIGVENIAALSTTEYWVVILGAIPLLLIISFITFKTIELPGMSKNNKFSLWLTRRNFTSKALN